MKKVVLLIILSFCFSGYAQDCYEVCSWQVETRQGGLLFGISDTKDGADVIMKNFQELNRGSVHDISDHAVKYKFTIYPVNKVDNPVTLFQNYANQSSTVLSAEVVKLTEIDKKTGIDLSFDFYLQVRDDDRDFVRELTGDQTYAINNVHNIHNVKTTKPTYLENKPTTAPDITYSNTQTSSTSVNKVDNTNKKHSTVAEVEYSYADKKTLTTTPEIEYSYDNKKASPVTEVEYSYINEKSSPKAEVEYSYANKKATPTPAKLEPIIVEEKKYSNNTTKKKSTSNNSNQSIKRSLTNNAEKPYIKEAKNYYTEDNQTDGIQVVLWEVMTRSQGLLFGISNSKDLADVVMVNFQEKNIGTKYDISDYPAKYKMTSSLDATSVENFKKLTTNNSYKVISADDIKSLEIIRSRGFDSGVDYYMDTRNADREFVTKRLSYIYNGFEKYRILPQNGKYLVINK